MEVSMRENIIKSIINTKELFRNSKSSADSESNKFILSLKEKSEYGYLKSNQASLKSNTFFDRPLFKEEKKQDTSKQEDKEPETGLVSVQSEKDKEIISSIPSKYQLKNTEDSDNLMLSLYKNENHISYRKEKRIKPKWHAPWKLYRVISGHTGWVRCIDVDPTNQWFVTGSNDRVIKFWDLASGKLKLSLTGHVHTVRGLVISPRHPYLFSCGEDKMIKCWDLEQNKVVRHYHGHLSGVHTLALHPTLDIIVTGGRDCAVRVWDIRSKQPICAMEGHSDTISSIVCQEYNPQIISGAHDNTVRLWDLSMQKSAAVLTHHKKSIRAVAFHPEEFTFASAGADSIKLWELPQGKFVKNLSGHNTILNAMAINQDSVLVSGGDDGSLKFWDYHSGYNFQETYSQVQPGSLSCEAGIYTIKFDKSSTRMITGECDKTIKMWKEDPTATPENFPITFS